MSPARTAACHARSSPRVPPRARHGRAAERGRIVDESGRELGSHDGFWRFTPGQRRGLGVAAPEPLFALRTDALTNTVTVGPRASLAATSVRARGRLYLDVTRV